MKTLLKVNNILKKRKRNREDYRRIQISSKRLDVVDKVLTVQLRFRNENYVKYA